MKTRISKKKIYIDLLNNEQVTFFLKKSQLDFVSKDFGSYVTPSFFSRCKRFKLLPALINKNKKTYLVLVKMDKISTFNKYLEKNNFFLIMWIKKKFLTNQYYQ
jgi:hypothetical protein